MIPVKFCFFQHFLFEFVEIWFSCFSIVPIFPVDIKINICSNYLLIMRPGLYCGCGTTEVLFFMRNVRTGSAVCVWEYLGEETSCVTSKIPIISFIWLLLFTTKCLSILLDSLFDIYE